MSSIFKQSSLDLSIPINYCPVALLPFLTKQLEKPSILGSSTSFPHTFLNSLQSGLWPYHSTETTLSEIASDLLIAKPNGLFSVLILLETGHLEQCLSMAPSEVIDVQEIFMGWCWSCCLWGEIELRKTCIYVCMYVWARQSEAGLGFWWGPCE